MIEAFKRPMSKFITANNIAIAVVHCLGRTVMGGEEPTEEVLRGLEPTRISIAEYVIKQLDAYDQRT